MSLPSKECLCVDRPASSTPELQEFKLMICTRALGRSLASSPKVYLARSVLLCNLLDCIALKVFMPALEVVTSLYIVAIERWLIWPGSLSPKMNLLAPFPSTQSLGLSGGGMWAPLRKLAPLVARGCSPCMMLGPSSRMAQSIKS